MACCLAHYKGLPGPVATRNRTYPFVRVYLASCCVDVASADCSCPPHDITLQCDGINRGTTARHSLHHAAVLTHNKASKHLQARRNKSSQSSKHPASCLVLQTCLWLLQAGFWMHILREKPTQQHQLLDNSHHCACMLQDCDTVWFATTDVVAAQHLFNLLTLTSPASLLCCTDPPPSRACTVAQHHGPTASDR